MSDAPLKKRTVVPSTAGKNRSGSTVPRYLERERTVSDTIKSICDEVPWDDDEVPDESAGAWMSHRQITLYQGEE